jgi:hypothetical protein
MNPYYALCWVLLIASTGTIIILQARINKLEKELGKR